MHYSMPKPDKALRQMLAQFIVDPSTVEPDLRGSRLEDDGRSVGGRPRGASAKHATNRRRAYGPKSKFDSFHS